MTMSLRPGRPSRQQACRLAGWIGCASIVVLSLVPGSERPHTGMPGQFEHVLAYALTAAAFGLGYRERRIRLALVAMLIGLAVVLETAQILIPGRVAQALDVAAGSLGAVLGMTAAAAAAALTKR